MFSGLKLKQQGILLVAIPLLIEILFLFCVAFFIRQGELQAVEAQEQLDKMKPVASITQLYLEASSCLFLLGISGKEAFADRFEALLQTVSEQIASLKSGLSVQQGRLETLNQLSSIDLQIQNLSKDLKNELQQGGFAALAILTDTKKRNAIMGTFSDIAPVLKNISSWQESDRRNLLHRIKETQKRLRQVLIAGILSNLVLALLLNAIYSKSLRLKIEVIADNCKRFASGKALKEPLEGSNELAELDQLFHRMAAQLLENEKRERAAVEEATDIICTLDASGKFCSVNQAGEKLWGYKKNELQELSVFQLIAKEKRADFEELIISSLSQTEALVKDFPVYSISGEIIETRWTIRNVSSKNLIYCNVRDVSVEKETERLKDSLVSMITHDLRTPATSIGLFLAILAKGSYGELEPSSITLVGDAEYQCKQLISIISAFLDLEKIDSNSFEISKQNIDLSSLLDGLCDKLEADAEQASRPLKLNDQSRGAMILGDQRLLESCLEELLMLSIKQKGNAQNLCILLKEKKGNCIEIEINGLDASLFARPLQVSFRELLSSEISDSTESFESYIKLSHLQAILRLHGGSCQLKTLGSHAVGLSILLPSNSSSNELARAQK
ncbi:MAG: PAS domain S-box protein [Candidatus Obscuribacterales bacterium]|nr:PAS domain S-box protein [Candidatus Obscuribacterales bacterium]